MFTIVRRVALAAATVAILIGMGHGQAGARTLEEQCAVATIPTAVCDGAGGTAPGYQPTEVFVREQKHAPIFTTVGEDPVTGDPIYGFVKYPDTPAGQLTADGDRVVSFADYYERQAK